MLKIFATITLFLVIGLSDSAADSRTIRVGVSHNPPISIIDEDDGVSGLAIDVINDIAAVNGWTVK